MARPEPIPRGLRGAESGWVTPGRRGGAGDILPWAGALNSEMPKCQSGRAPTRRHFIGIVQNVSEMAFGPALKGGRAEAYGPAHRTRRVLAT